jgi:AraC family transcriptional regulator
LAKIALELERALARRAESGEEAGLTDRVLARGNGWMVRDVICTSGPGDRAFEEQHSALYIAVVAAGTFEYRSGMGQQLMTPGSLLLGNPEQRFECGHAHAAGDRCVSFGYSPEFFEQVTADRGLGGRGALLKALRVPAVREVSSLVAQACAGLSGGLSHLAWEQLAVGMAARVVSLLADERVDEGGASPRAVARVTEAIREIEAAPGEPFTLARLARGARMSPYHFLRSFEQVSGTTPHQFILRVRLREAAERLTAEESKVLDVALDCGFGDVSNFNRTFRAEFGCSPRAYRRASFTTETQSTERGESGVRS